MKINFKSMVSALAVIGFSTGVFAAGKEIEMGINISNKMPRGALELSQVLIPISKHLSAKTGSSVYLVPERSMSLFKNHIRSGQYPFLYVNPELAVIAIEMGYTPILKTSTKIDSVVMMRADANVNSWADLYGKKIATVDNTLIKTIADAAFYKTGTTGLIDYTISPVKTQKDLFDIFASGVGDGIVIRGSTANTLIEQNPGKFKIALRAGSVPAYILLANKDVAPQQVAVMKGAFLDLNKPANKSISDQLDNDLEPGFTDVVPEDLTVIREVMNIVEPDYKLATPAKK